MIELIVMRHGEAVMLSPDEQRPLTQSGCLAVQRVAQKLPQVEQVWVSPYVRAQQTWQNIVQVNPVSSQVSTNEKLTPESDLNELLQQLSEFDGKSLLLVGHNPLFSYLATSLAGESYLALGTANAARLQGDLIAPGCMTLVEIL